MPQTYIDFLGLNSFTALAVDNWTILGLTGNDTLTGNSLADTIEGGVDNDRLFGLGGNDVLNGGDGDDFLDGGSGDDYLSGEIGNDTLFGSLGSDFFNGGTGTDVANYGSFGSSIILLPTGSVLKGGGATDQLFQVETIIANAGFSNNTIDASGAASPASINVNLGLSTNNLQVLGGPVLTFTVTNFDDVIGTNQSDTITGDGQANILSGNAGNDIINGGLGKDTLNGGLGNDTLNGGDDNDTLNGGDDNDTLVGSLGSDFLNGGAGTDVANYSSFGSSITLLPTGTILKAGGTTDQLFQVETIIANAGFSNNTIDASGAASPASINVNLGLSTNNLQVLGGPVLTFTVTNFDDVIGTNQSDTITGDGQANILSGNAGNDIINGGLGNDTLNGGLGNDTLNGGDDNDTLVGSLGSDFLNGGAGTDVANYSSFGSSITLLPTGTILKAGGTTDQLFQVETIIANAGFSNNTIDASGAASPASINVNLGLSTNNLQVLGGPVLTFTVTNFDDVIGTNQSDTITGDGQANILSGNAGNDIINGGLGNDTLNGGLGNDTLNGGDDNDTLVGSLGSDFLNGGAGTDVANYSSFGSSITLLPTGTILKAGGTTDQLFQVETIIANAGFSNNTIDASGATSPASINVNLGLSTNNLQVLGGPVLTFTVTNFDDVIGTNQSDTITGDGQANILSGNAGNDIINGGLGNDTLNGGLGNDTLNGGDDNDTLVGSLGSDFLNGGAGTDVANYSSFGSSITLLPTGTILKAGGTTDQLFQVETIIANAGFSNNTIDASGAASPASINVNLGLSTNNLQVLGGPVLTFTVTNFDDVIGTNQSDTITGDGQANILSGNAGNDIINGGLGNDTLNGGLGNDTLNGGDDNDTLVGSLGSDFLNGGAGTDVANYSSFGRSITLLPTGTILKAGGTTDQLFQVETIIANAGFSNNTIDASGAASPASINVNLGLSTNNLQVLGGPVLTFTVTNFDDVIGTNQSDTITGDGQANILSGNAGNDIINGGLGNDTLNGGLGNDTLNGGDDNDTLVGSLGSDFLNGGAGTDVANYSSFGSSITLLPTGTILKAGGTTDQLFQVETIIANAGFSNNTIDASGAASPASINVNLGLSTNNLQVLGGPVLTFTVTNFDDVIGTNQSDTITGDGQANILSGNAGNDIINGGLGKDTLNGGSGIDTLTGNGNADEDIFVFQFGQSTISNPDQITDFTINTINPANADKIGLSFLPVSFTRAANSTATTRTALATQVFTDANGLLAGNQALGASSAALVQVTSGVIAGTYLFINDSTATLSSTNDLLVNITVLSGTLPGFGNITPVSSFFTVV